MNSKYQFIDINDVTCQTAMQENGVIVNMRRNDMMYCQPINCNRSKFVKYMDDQHMKFIGARHGVYRFIDNSRSA